MEQHLSYSIIIVNWNSKNQCKTCLKSIENAEKAGFKLEKVVIVDNASSDDSAKNFDDYSYHLEVIENTTNRGFSVACNQGAARCSSDYLIFLNPDTILFQNTLTNLNQFIMKKRECIKIIGIQLVDQKNKITKNCSRFPTKTRAFSKTIGLTKVFPSTGCIMNDWDHKKSARVDQVMGAFFVTERSLFCKLKGFDERFFVYYEEVDFCKRAYDLGYFSFYYVGAKAYHKGGGTSEQVLDKRLFYILRSYLQYEKKHRGLSSMYVAFLIELLEYVTRSVDLILRKQLEKIYDLNQAYFMLFKDLKTIFRG